MAWLLDGATDFSLGFSRLTISPTKIVGYTKKKPQDPQGDPELQGRINVCQMSALDLVGRPQVDPGLIPLWWEGGDDYRPSNLLVQLIDA